MALPNVVGVGTGTDEGTGEPVILVFVSKLVPRGQLGEHQVVPSELEGVPVRVNEIGAISAPPHDQGDERSTNQPKGGS